MVPPHGITGGQLNPYGNPPIGFNSMAYLHCSALVALESAISTSANPCCLTVEFPRIYRETITVKPAAVTSYRMPTALTEYVRGQLALLKELGWDNTEVADMLGIHPVTVRRHLDANYLKGDDSLRRKTSKFTDEDLITLMSLFEVDINQTNLELAAKFLEYSGKSISQSTVRRLVNSFTVHSACIPKSVLTAELKQWRYDYANSLLNGVHAFAACAMPAPSHVLGEVPDLSLLVFVDEKLLLLAQNGGHIVSLAKTSNFNSVPRLQC